MAITYEWKITALKKAPSLDGLSDVITHVNFEYKGSDDSINVIKDDAYTHTPDKKYDLILIDLWWGHEDITDEIVSNLENNYKNYLEEGGKIIIPMLFKSFTV